MVWCRRYKVVKNVFYHFKIKTLRFMLILTKPSDPKTDITFMMSYQIPWENKYFVNWCIIHKGMCLLTKIQGFFSLSFNLIFSSHQWGAKKCVRNKPMNTTGGIQAPPETKRPDNTKYQYLNTSEDKTCWNMQNKITLNPDSPLSPLLHNSKYSSVLPFQNI